MNIAHYIAATALIVSLSGCGAIIEMRAGAAEFDMQNIQSNLEDSAVKSPVFQKVSSIAVADFSSQLGEDYPTDNKRLYRAIVSELSKLLVESGQFKVATNDEFTKALEKSGLILDIAAADEEELESGLARVGKQMGVHGVVSFGLDTVGNAASMGNQMSAVGDLLVSGHIEVAMEADLKMLRSKNSETLWKQRSEFSWISGSNGLTTTKNADLRKKVQNLLKPMVDQMIADRK